VTQQKSLIKKLKHVTREHGGIILLPKEHPAGPVNFIQNEFIMKNDQTLVL